MRLPVFRVSPAFVLLSLLIVPQISMSQNRCQTKYTEKNIFNSLEKDFSSIQNQLPFKNFSFNWGVYDLASCWSLSHLQRMYFYLNSGAQKIDKFQLADQIRGGSPYQNENGQWAIWPIQNLKLIPRYPSGEWQAVENGFQQTGEQSGSIVRSLSEDVKAYQVKRFHDPKNIEYLKGEIPRTPIENVKTLNELKAMIVQNELPMIILRPLKSLQHVVVVKSFTNDRFVVYDSNDPNNESEFYYNSNTGYFYAPQIVQGFQGVDSQKPVGVFIVDSEDIKKYKKVLYSEYKKNCP